MAEKKNAVGKTEKKENLSTEAKETKSVKNDQDTKSMAPKVDERIKYYILAIAAVLIIAVVLMVLYGPDAKDKKPAAEPTATEQAKVYPRQFDYFVSKSDENYDEYMDMIAEIEEEYKDQVMFTITDIDDDQSARDNFPVDVFGTPMLIVVTSTGDISAMEGKCSDREKIVGYIEEALGDSAE